jgi:phosphoglycolate phosphatase
LSKNWIDADVYLFDIDGTLLNAYGGAHYNAFHSALKHTFNLDCKIDGVPLHGNTDIGILRAVLLREGLPSDAFDLHRHTLLNHMCDQVELNRAQIRSELCPSIQVLVSQLDAQQKLLGIASGNLERIGWLKLDAAHLRDYFAFGSFADRWETRADIFRAGIAEAHRRLGRAASVCIVGDTPADISAAKAVGAPVIAVATGIYSKAELLKFSPDICVDSCSDLLPEINTNRVERRS